MLRDMGETVPPDDTAQLLSELERLRAANAELESRAGRHWRWRRVALVLLLVLGCGFSAAAVIAIWTRATVLNTDRYVDTMAPIARSASVQKAVADKLDAKITGAVDFQALAREIAPKHADVLAPAIQAGADATKRSRP